TSDLRLQKNSKKTRVGFNLGHNIPKPGWVPLTDSTTPSKSPSITIRTKGKALMTDMKFVTRKGGVKLANELGIPLRLSRVNKDAHYGVGPKPAAKYGPAHLYDPAEFLRYAETCCKPVEVSPTAA